jgi:hypothetical protein
MTLVVNVGQWNTEYNRNEKPQGDEDGERQANPTRCQRCKQQRRQTEENGHSPDVRHIAHSSPIIR